MTVYTPTATARLAYANLSQRGIKPYQWAFTLVKESREHGVSIRHVCETIEGRLSKLDGMPTGKVSASTYNKINGAILMSDAGLDLESLKDDKHTRALATIVGYVIYSKFAKASGLKSTDTQPLVQTVIAECVDADKSVKDIVKALRELEDELVEQHATPKPKSAPNATDEPTSDEDDANEDTPTIDDNSPVVDVLTHLTQVRKIIDVSKTMTAEELDEIAGALYTLIETVTERSI